jgi:glycosyltransferase involved in cell wall biosynthesis
MRVAIFTDNDFDKVNGVTTTLKAVLRNAPPDIQPRVYTCAGLQIEDPDYLALRSASVPIPYYSEMRMYVPRVRLLRQRLHQDDVRVVHLTTPGPLGLAARYLIRNSNLPLVGSFHTQLAEYTATLSGSKRLGSLMATYLRWVYGCCDRVLVPSTDTGDRLVANGWDASRMTVWARGVDADVFSPGKRSTAMREAWRVSDRRPAILYAGRISSEKGLSLLESIGSLLHRHGVAHRFVLVGEGPLSQELRERLPDAVFTGRLAHPEVAVAMASADMFLFPSDTDTAGNVVLEALACGLPVLVSNIGGPRESVGHGETGFVCRSADTLDFASRAQQLLNNRGLRASMSQRARAYALGRTWKASLEPLFDAYRALALAAASTGQDGIGQLPADRVRMASGL